MSAASVQQPMAAVGMGSFSAAGPLDQQRQAPGAAELLQQQKPQQQQQQPPNSPPSQTLHSHRQNHNSSKLPAFRFADLKSPTISPPQLAHQSLAHQQQQQQQQQQQHSDTGPVASSPNPAPAGGSPSADPDPVALPDPAPATSQNPQAPSPTHRGSEKHASPPAALTSTSAAPPPVTAVAVAAASPSSSPPFSPPARSRASTLQPAPTSPIPVDVPASQTRRPASYPDTQPTIIVDAAAAGGGVGAQPPQPSSTAVRTRTRRSLVSRRSNAAAGASSSTGPPPTLTRERLHAVEAIEAAQSQSQASAVESQSSSTKDSPPGQRELMLPKALSNSSPTDERRTSASHRPPVSYRPPLNANAQSNTSTPVRVPPIRGFRSSGSRKSLTLDMNSRSRFLDMGDDLPDSNHDRTLRALEGRPDQDFMHMTSPPLSARHDAFDGEDTGDVFLRIAREEPLRRQPDEPLPDETQSVVSRVRSSHRRPLSSTVPTYKPTSPPRIPRRLSDQESSASRSRKYDDDRASEVSRYSTYRALAREKAASVHPGEDLNRTRTTGLRPSPLTPRSTAFQDPDSGSSPYGRRRGSITDNSTPPTRSSTYKASTLGHGHSKAYNSSPLVRSFDFHRHQGAEGGHGLEGTESTASTTAPSTVWDELDDLKSRIHRLELTGKLPSTSGAAMSRISDERPPTATTTVTTVSSSPKRPGGRTGLEVNTGAATAAAAGAPPTEAGSATSAQREAHPILHSALAKSKVLLDPEVYRALESAAHDAIALSAMMGVPGQPGPISSGASTIGSGTTITDRQLRRKADSVCRSLTELCLALGEDANQARAVVPAKQTQVVPEPTEVPTTPTINKTFTNLASQRRPSNVAEPNMTLARSNTSPRAISKFEERRINLMTSSTLPTSRVTTSTPSTPLEPTAHRRSSLLVARSRRAGTEEPEDGRKSTLLLRSRRAGTEEPDEGRKTSLLVRNRRGTVGSEDDESRFRAPSRAHTELSTARAVAHEQAAAAPPPPPVIEPAVSSALPRRRFVSSSLSSSRLTTPLASNVTPPRRYLERSTPDRDGNSVADKLAEDRGQRHMSLGQTMLLGRNTSIRRVPRDSGIPAAPPSATSGVYR